MSQSHEFSDGLENSLFAAHDRPNKVFDAHKRASEYNEMLATRSASYEDIRSFAREVRTELDGDCGHIGQEIVINGRIKRVGHDFDPKSQKLIETESNEYDAIDEIATSEGYILDIPSEEEYDKGKDIRILHLARANTEPLLRKPPGATVYESGLYYIPVDGTVIIDLTRPSSEPYMPYIEYHAPELLQHIDETILNANPSNSNEALAAIARINFDDYAAQLDRDEELEDEISKYINSFHDFTSILPSQVTGAESIVVRPYPNAPQLVEEVSSAGKTIFTYIKRIEFMPYTIAVSGADTPPRAQLCLRAEIPQSDGSMLTSHIPLSQELQVSLLPITDVQY